MAEDYQELIKNSIRNTETFISATFKGQQKGKFVPWREVRVRQVEIKEKRHFQFSYLDSHKDITKNYTDEQLPTQLDQLLVFPFKSIAVETADQKIQIQKTKKGKAIIHRRPQTERAQAPVQTHDYQKEYALPEQSPDAFLQAVGIMSEEGAVKASMRDKFRQINAFLKLLEQSLPADVERGEPIHIVDFGCGNAYLSFATYHYFSAVRGNSARLTGVDLKADLMRKHAQTVEQLGWDQLTFQPNSIADFTPDGPVDMVLALHACDTATDEALYQAIRSKSRYIFAAPCCHNHLHQQLSQQPTPDLFAPVFRHGILKNRTADILTDTFRAMILRLAGYRTDVMEFVDMDHTAKNLMIRAIAPAERSHVPQKLHQEYAMLKEYWGVTPYLETLLGQIEPVW